MSTPAELDRALEALHRTARKRRAAGTLSDRLTARIDHLIPGFLWDQTEADAADAVDVIVMLELDDARVTLERTSILADDAIVDAFHAGTEADLVAALVQGQVAAYDRAGLTVETEDGFDDALTPDQHRLLRAWLRRANTRNYASSHQRPRRAT